MRVAWAKVLDAVEYDFEAVGEGVTLLIKPFLCEKFVGAGLWAGGRKAEGEEMVVDMSLSEFWCGEG